MPTLTRREVLAAAAGAVVLAVVVYLPHIRNGGWVLDDWMLAADFRLAPSQGLLDLWRQAEAETTRLGNAAIFVAQWEIGGTGQAAYLTTGALLTAIEGLLLYVLLRLLSVTRVVAGFAGALLIALPVIDATRLWPAAFAITVAVELTLAGFIVAALGLRAQGRRARIAWHAGALACFAAAVLTYEIVAPVIAAGGLLYLLGAGMRPWLKRAPLDLAVVVASVAVTASRTAANTRKPNTHLGFMEDRADQIWSAARPVFLSIVPGGRHLDGLLGLALLVGLVAVCMHAVRTGSPLARNARRYAVVAVGGVVTTAVGFVMLLPADPYYVPRLTGLGNRTSVAAAVGVVVVVAALAELAGVAIAHVGRRPVLATPAAGALLLVVLVHNVRVEWNNQKPWHDSWIQSQRVVSAMQATVPRDLPADASIVTFHHTTNILPADVSVFSASWDLRGAARLAFRQNRVVAHPWSLKLRCTTNGVSFPDVGASTMRYGDLWFVDTVAYRSYRIDSRASCDRRRAELVSRGRG
jgi:hypothetical protein